MDNTHLSQADMPKKLQLYICEHFKAETDAVISSGGFDEVIVSYFAARCSRPLSSGKQLSSIPVFNQLSKDDQMICGCSCLSPSDKTFLDEKNIIRLDHSTCFEMFAPQTYINQLVSKGVYIVTPGWVLNWKSLVTQWGSQSQAREIFSETISRLVLLDTGANADSHEALAEFGKYIGREWESVPVGLDHYRYFLENKILKWRIEQKEDSLLAGRSKDMSSDHAMALDLLADLPHTQNEKSTAKRIMEIMSMMFAAKKIYYLSTLDPRAPELWSLPSDIDAEGVTERLSNFDESSMISDSGKGLCFSISVGKERLAVIEVDDIAMPENIDRYQNLTLAIQPVFAISIQNSLLFSDMQTMNTSLQDLSATKDKFFSIIAHDLRRPFATVIEFSSVLIERIEENNYESADQMAKIIKNTSEKALALLINLLEWSRSQTGMMKYNPALISIVPLIDNIVKLFEEQANQKSVLILKDIPPGLSLLVDVAMIETVVRNLLSNAIKFTNPGGRIRIRADKTNNDCTLSISDNGVGIPENLIQNLFSIDRSKSTPGTQNEQGTGLGLLLCKEFVEKHEGQIWVESKLGVGSTFYFSVPN